MMNMTSFDGLALGGAVVAARLRRRRPVRNERELVDALGAPLLAARPLRREAPVCGTFRAI